MTPVDRSFSKTAHGCWPLLFVLMFVASGAYANTTLDIEVTFGTSTVTASGITPGGSALFFGSGRQKNGYDQTLIRVARSVTDDDHDGSVTFDLGKPVPATTIWVVVDMTDGRYALATPTEAVAEAVSLPGNVLRRSQNGATVDGFGYDHPTLELLYIQPGSGAWAWSAADGRALDRDGPNGVTLVNAADGKNVAGTSGAPADFALGGTLVAVDWYKMQYSVVQLDGPTLGRAQ